MTDKNDTKNTKKSTAYRVRRAKTDDPSPEGLEALINGQVADGYVLDSQIHGPRANAVDLVFVHQEFKRHVEGVERRGDHPGERRSES